MGIQKIQIKTSIDKEFLLGSLEVFVEADVKREQTEETSGKVFLWAQLLDEQKEEADRIFPVELEEETQFCMEVKCPKLWNTEYPCLYELVLELRDEENRLLGCTSRMTGFWRAEAQDDILYLNDRSMNWRRVGRKEERKLTAYLEEWVSGYPVNSDAAEQIRGLLANLRNTYKNCLFLPQPLCTTDVRELCLSYGMLLLEEDRTFAEGTQMGEHPDFELQVVEEGVLIENRSRFVNTNVYALQCEILLGERILQQSVVEADVPAGSSRYLELPFIKPRNPGMYRYRVSLCLKKDMPWGEKGTAVASGETLISNMWFG